MAISHVAAIGSNSSKTTGTTLAVTATPGTQPAVGDLIIVTCGRDDLATDPLTGDSITDGHGNPYTRVVLGSSSDAADISVANAAVGVVFWCVLAAAWSGSTTVTWTHPSVNARSMQVSHFTPTSGYLIELYDTATEASILGNAGPLPTGAPVVEGDLVFAAVAGENDASVNVPTGDSDTVAGSWSVISTVGTSGGVANTNIYTSVQYKLTTAAAIQAYTLTPGSSSESALILLTFHERSANGVGLVGVGAQVVSNTGSVTPAIPPNVQADDLLFMVIGGRPSSNAADGVSIAGGTDGWAQHGSTSFREVGTVDLSVQVWWKIHDGSESAPTVSTNTVLAAVGAGDRGFSAQIAAFRGMVVSTPFDVAAVNSDSAAAATWTPTGVTTATNDALALSVVVSVDISALNFDTSQSFRMAMGLSDYDTVTGSDHAIGLAFKPISAASAVTEPTWSRSVGSGTWAGISTALTSLGSNVFVSAAAATASAAAGNATITISRPTAAAAATGTGRNAVGTVRTSPTAAAAAAVGLDATVTAGQPGVDVDAGTAAASGAGQTARVSTGTAAQTATATAAALNASVGATATAGVGVGVGVGLQPVAGSSGSVTPTTGTAAGSGLNAAASTAVTAAAQTATGVGVGLNLTGTATAAPGVAAGVGAALPAAARANVNVAAQTATAAGAASNATVSGAVHAQAAAAAAGAAANPATISAMKPTVGLAVGAGLDAAVRLDVVAELAAAVSAAADLAVSVGAVATAAAATGAALDPAEIVTSSATSPLDTIFSVLVDPGRTWVVLEVGP